MKKILGIIVKLFLLLLMFPALILRLFPGKDIFEGQHTKLPIGRKKKK